MLAENPLRRIEGPDPPNPYPPARVRLWLLAAWAGHTDADAQAGPKPGDVRVQRWPEMYVADWRMKAQLKAWLNAQVGREPSFRQACVINGWNRDSATRGVDMAVELISIGLNSIK
ncbi:hypothetical protein [Methylobacterium goesingense]|uniref:Uncharacterized protein n=1 Tax=Methylobacterium goesingense TaxID=243690 RepID=A0ABV2L1J4_9HYPH|nr:hypothetical protein [Methylobacterium goesingense]